MKNINNKFRPEWEPLGNDTVTESAEPEKSPYSPDLQKHQTPGYHKGYNTDKTETREHSEYILDSFRYQ